MSSVLVRMAREDALELGRLREIGTTAGWNHGGEIIYEIEPREEVTIPHQAHTRCTWSECRESGREHQDKDNGYRDDFGRYHP